MDYFEDIGISTKYGFRKDLITQVGKILFSDEPDIYEAHKIGGRAMSMMNNLESEVIEGTIIDLEELLAQDKYFYDRIEFYYLK